MNSSVAASISQGITESKVLCGVKSRSSAPAMPPARLTISSGQKRKVLRFSGNPRDRPTRSPGSPGISAIVLEALAMIEGTPVKTSAGKVKKHASARDRVDQSGGKRGDDQQ